MERAINRGLIDRYLPGFVEFFMDARRELDAEIVGTMEFHIPDADLPLVRSLMDETKRLEL